MKPISVVIPNYNGRELLEKNLPYLFKALRNYPCNSEVIIVDDASGDGSRDFIKKNFPQIKIITVEKNSGFAFAVNLGIKSAKYPLVLILNTDIEVDQNFLNPLVKHFDNQDIFSVSCFENRPSGFLIGYPNFKLGMFCLEYFKDPFSLKGTFEVFFPAGSASLIDKEKFLSLGGFDELFSPFYWEDIDLGLRAYKKGLRCILEPNSKVYHITGKSILKKHNQNYANKIYWRNYFLFNWKNLTTTMLFFHLFFLPITFFIASFYRKGYFLGFLEALKNIKDVFKKRKKVTAQHFLYQTDEVLNYFKNLPPSIYGILYITDTGTFLGGGEFSLYSILEEKRNKFRVYLVSPSYGDFTKNVEGLGIKVFVVAYKSFFNPFGLFTNLKNLIWFFEFIRDYKINLIHANSTGGFILLASISAFCKKIPFIWHVRATKSAGILDFLLALLSTKIIVVSEAVKKRFRFFPFKSKITRIYNGIDLNKISQGKQNLKEVFGFRDEDVIVGSVGRFVSWKGYHYLLKALAILVNFKSNLKVLILGLDYDKNNPYVRYLEKLTEKLNLKDKVFFLKKMEDVASFISMLDVFVFTSKNEPFGRALIEAMALKKPIVAFKSGAIPEIVEGRKEALLAKFGDYKDLAKKIFLLLNDKDLTEKISQNAFLRAKNFDLKINLESIDKVYKEILNKNIIKVDCDFCKSNYAKLLDREDNFFLVECIRCNLIHIAPKPTFNFLKSNYGKNYYQSWERQQANIRKKIFLNRFKKIEKYKKIGNILDIGAGLAEFLAIAKQKGWQVWGTEISEYAASFAKENFKIDIFCGSLEEANCKDNFFDVVTLWHVLEHIGEPIKYLKEIKRILKKDGLLVIALPNPDDYIYQLVYKIFKTKSPKEYTIKSREHHIFCFKQKTLRRILLSLGFSIIKIDIDKERALFYERLLDNFAYIFYKIFRKNFGIAYEIYAKKL
ncbi:MAG: glycosyltransferase [Candidatus Omnitrophica bacterium]|nr:glycosyltransferase [Candidatus Omnitrophota bacterium]